MSKGGNTATAPRVSAPVGGSKAGPASFGRTVETGGPGGSVATQFSSRGLEAFRNPGPRVSVKGTEGPAGAKMRIDTFSKPVSTPSAKAEFSNPGVTGPQRNASVYATTSEFAKGPDQTTPKATITTELKPVPESSASQSSSFRPVTDVDLGRFQQQATQEAQRILGNTLPAGSEVKGQVEVRNNTVKIISIDKPKAPAAEPAQPVDGTATKKTEPTVSKDTQAKSPETSSMAKPEVHNEPLQVVPGTQLSGDTTGTLSSQEVKDLVQQPAYTGEAKPVDTTSQEMKDSVRRLPDRVANKPENPTDVVSDVTAQNQTAKESEAVADRKEAIKQELQQIEQQQISSQTKPEAVEKTTETQSAASASKTKPEQAVSEAKTEQKPVTAETKPVETTRNVEEQQTARDTQIKPAEPVGKSTPKSENPVAAAQPTNETKPVAVTPVTAAKVATAEPAKAQLDQVADQQSVDTKIATSAVQQVPVSQEVKEVAAALQEVAPAPINPSEKAPVVIADAPNEEKALQIREERAAAFQKELQSIKEQVAALTETTPAESVSAQTIEAITVLPDVKPLPVPDAVIQVKTSGAEFGNLLKKRQKEKLTPVSVSNSDQQSQIAGKAEAITVKTQRTSFLKGFLRTKVAAASEKAKVRAQEALGHVGKYSEVIDWDEILGKKKRKSAYEEITGRTSTVDAILEAVQVKPGQEAGTTSAQQVPVTPQPVQPTSESISLTTPAEIVMQPAPLAVNLPTEQQQEAVVAQVLPNTQPVATPEQVQQLSNQAEQAAAEDLGTGGMVIFAANRKGDSLNFILDKEAKQARQKALENGVRNARMAPDGTITGADVVAAAPDKHTSPLVSGAAELLGIKEDGSEITLWNRVSTIEALPQREMIGRALEEENNLKPVAIGENGNRADEKDLALVLSSVKKREELGLAA
jgi:hypothetical protein